MADTTGSRTLHRGRARVPLVRPAVLSAVAAVVVGCGTGDVADPGREGTAPATATESSSTADPSDDTTGNGTTDTSTDDSGGAPGDTATSTPAAPSPSEPSSDESALPGEPYDHPYIDEGDVLGVVGVAHDDTLSVRAGPALGAPVVTTLSPTTYGLVSTGHTRHVDGRFWHEVTVDGVTGWVSWRFVSFIAATTDDTARFVANHGDVRADTMAALGRDVAAFYEPPDPETPARVVMTVAPSVGDVGEVTYDVLGIQDDAGAGYRIHVVAMPDDDGEGFAVRTIEVTDLCYRGGTPGGTCP